MFGFSDQQQDRDDEPEIVVAAECAFFPPREVKKQMKRVLKKSIYLYNSHGTFFEVLLGGHVKGERGLL